MSFKFLEEGELLYFILVTGAIMSVSILIIYKLCQYFGLELMWLSLVLCALLAFAVNGAAIMFSPFLDQGHYIRLAVMVLLAAAFVTLVNELLLRHEHRQGLATATPDGAQLLIAQQEPEETVPAETEPEPVPEAKSEPVISQPFEEVAKDALPGPEAATMLPITEAEAAANAEAKAKLSARLFEAVKANKPTAQELPDDVPANGAELVQEAAEPIEPQAEISGKEEPVASAEDTKAAKEEPAAQAKETETAADAPEPPDTAEETAEAAAPEPPEGQAAQTSDHQAEVAALATLDELLDFAYAHKDAEPEAAIAAYRAAIRRFPDDSYAPFLIIELAGIYKETARYAEAINLYAEAMAMPIIADDDAMVQEFNRTLRYLGTVQDILNRHHALTTPFSRINPEILQEIEAELEKRQMH